MAAVAFFIAVAGGAAYAATIGPQNIQDDAVRSHHIKDGTVQRRDLASGAVTSRKVIDRSLLRQDINPTQIPPGAYRILTSAPPSPSTPRRSGIELQLDCELSGRPRVQVIQRDPGLLELAGTYAVNGVLKTVNSSNGLVFGSDEGKPIDLDLIGRVRPRTWTNFQLMANYNPSTKRCSFFGMILSPRGP